MTSSLKVLFGSTMHLVVHQIMPAAQSPEQNTVELWRLIKAEYDRQRSTARFSQLKLSMFNPKGGASVLFLRVRCIFEPSNFMD